MTSGTESIIIDLTGRIDSGNAAQVEKEILAKLDGGGAAAVVLDAEKLEYISSAGLRILLRLHKICPDLTVKGVNSQVYEIMEMTGFTEIMTVEKAYRIVSVEGCEVIGEGQNGKVYRIDHDNVVKTYKNADALSEIQHEREMARLALILGIPTAISYDVVRVGDSYGSVFELLDSRSFARILIEEPSKMDWCVREYAALLKKLHSIRVPPGKLPSVKEAALGWVRGMKSYLSEPEGEKLERMIADIPDRDTMIHGDFHTKNIVLSGGEVLLIDMESLSVGHPIFELAQMYNAFLGFSESDHEAVTRFQGFDRDVSKEFWNRTLRAYFETEDEGQLADIVDRIRCVSYARLIDWSRRHAEPGTEEHRTSREIWLRELTGLLARVDSLAF